MALAASKHVAANYGGPLLENSSLVEQNYPLSFSDASGARPPWSKSPTTTSDPMASQSKNSLRPSGIGCPSDGVHGPAAIPPVSIHNPPREIVAGGNPTTPPIGGIHTDSIIPRQPAISRSDGADFQDPNFQKPSRHHLDKIAYPNATAQHGPLDGLRRMGGIRISPALGLIPPPYSYAQGLSENKLQVC